MPILDSHSIEFISRGPEQTRRLGMRLGRMLKTGDVIGLVGDLGTGKTTLVQGVATGWGSPDPASSPTFVLVNVYRHPQGGKLFHLDAYRLSGPDEAEDLDLTTMLDSGPLVVEWAERIQKVLPSDHLQVTMSHIDENCRDMILSAHGLRYEHLLADIRKQIYGG
jgi:tRNA threonylcarbamoyladenosine biosynthesis protein TsaE